MLFPMLLLQLLRSSDYKSLASILSPQLFSVVPPSHLLAVAKKLQASRSDRQGWASLLHSRESWFKPQELQSSQELGNCVLRIFFDQVMNQDQWILDLRSDAFKHPSSAPKTTQWSPAPIFVKPDPTFLKRIRDLYIGFYGDRPELFDQAVDQLGLSAARETLRTHFGIGDQSRVRFSLATFQKTFAQVLKSCQASGTELDRDFLVLGLMLIGLYQNLEKLDQEFNVREAFASVIAVTTQSQETP